MEAAERALVVGAVKASIADRRLPPRAVLEEVEAEEEVLDTPEKTLLFLLPPATVWSIRDFVDASDAAAQESGLPARMRAIDAVAEERVTETHVGRIRFLTSQIARRLPLEGLPRTSSLLATACDEVERDADLAYELASHLLVNYVVRFEAELAAEATGN